MSRWEMLLFQIYELKNVILRVGYKFVSNFCLFLCFLFRVTKDLKGTKEREGTLEFEVTR